MSSDHDFTYRTTNRTDLPALPEMELRDGEMCWTSNGEHIDYEALTEQGYFVRETSKRCWCGGVALVVKSDSGVGGKLVCEESVQHAPLDDGRRAKHTILYIAGPMSGYPENNYPEFDEQARFLRNAGYTVVSPAEFGDGASYVDLMRMDIIEMLGCHAVAFLDRWWESVGARNEIQIAGVLKMPVRSVADWLQRAAIELS